MSLRRLDPRLAERHALAAVFHATWGHLYPEDGAGQWATYVLRELAAGLPLPAGFVALEAGRVVGTASLTVGDMDTHPEIGPWLACVWVAPAVRRRGIGAALVRHVEAHASGLGFERLYLYTEDRAPWYAALGWSALGPECYRGFDVTLMVRAFGATPGDGPTA